MNETILQFGAGNFLRGFIDLFVQELNETGHNIGHIVIVQSTEGDRAALLNAQNGVYHVVVRGVENGETVDRVQKVESVSRALVATTQWKDIVDVAVSPHLKTIVSNTTEAGFVLDPADQSYSPNTPPTSFPAKLTALLKTRFDAKQPGVLILPCELFDENADKLRALVLEQATTYGFTDPAFLAWLENDCVWANTLVDRIVSGKPENQPLLETDALLTVAEPYQFWAIEEKPGTEVFAPHPAVRRAPSIQSYSLRKVRILNGAHSALVAKTYGKGFTYVREAIADPEIRDWLNGLLNEEILPTVRDRVEDAEGFAQQTLDRFSNPFLDHKLSAILLHHDKKVPVRLVSTRDEFVEKFGKVPSRLQEAIDTPITP